MNKVFRIAFVLGAGLALPLISSAQSNAVLISVNLANYSLTVSKSGSTSSYPISYGGSEQVNGCVRGGNISVGCAPRECTASAPPRGQFNGVRTYTEYHSAKLNRTWNNVIFFTRGFMIRAATHDVEKIGTPTFTCGAIALKPSDSEEVYRLIDNVDPSVVSVEVQ